MVTCVCKRMYMNLQVKLPNVIKPWFHAELCGDRSEIDNLCQEIFDKTDIPIDQLNTHRKGSCCTPLKSFAILNTKRFHPRWTYHAPLRGLWKRDFHHPFDTGAGSGSRS